VYAVRLAVALAAAGLIAQACSSGPAGSPTRQTFESGDEGWIPFGPDAQVEVVHPPSPVASGKAALALHYTFTPGQYGSAILPLEAGQVANLAHLRFRIRTDHPTPIIVVLSERQPGGGYYSSWFWCQKDRWIDVDLVPSDFTLNEGPSDPADPNGRLDLAEVRGIGISDLGQAFQSLTADPAYPLVVEASAGSHTFFLDDLELVPGGTAPGERPRRVGDPARNLVTWISLGGVDLEIAGADNPLHAPGVSASYTRPSGRYVAISHSLLAGNFASIRRLTLPVASRTDASLMVYLEERMRGAALGPRYSRSVPVRGGSQRMSVSLALDEFQPDRTGPTDADGRLDGRMLKSISIVDITAAGAPRSASNTLWLGPIDAQ
jgi:hypothetical protein